eukprot:TRINITY_DN1533_c0_g1_i1.p2 TRINITY_DN1533_c0_g1~~TRINITY_DN1533_c0_g1_i1.p2  ORF type:complete len:177 (-),score=57.28 TRINITY_DN1533_c0_g1_i1:629-1090(-)
MASTRTFVGTVYYMAPERLMAQSYTSSVDIWSLGLLVLRCATAQMPFEGLTYWQLNQKLQDEPSPSLPKDQGFSDDMQRFVTLCLQKDATHRPTAAQLLQHPWVTDTQGSEDFQAHYCTWLKWAQRRIQAKQAEARSQAASSTEDLLAKAFDM